ncbi:MAG TPA: hypothetical protein VGG08_06830 [Solirubrobacteraceae bacterium]
MSALGSTAESCPATVMKTLGSVLGRVYHEGVDSERTDSARYMIERSPALRLAVEHDDATAARKAIVELIATGHMTDVTVMREGHVVAAVGGPALAPLRGTLTNAAGQKIATYVASVWADTGFAAEANGVAEGTVALRQGGKSIGGTLELPDEPLSSEGTLTRNGTTFQYTSFPAQAYPSGAAVTVYLLKRLELAEKACGQTSEDTTVNTLTQVANLIYQGETGARTLVQVKRVQHNAALLKAVSAKDPKATEAAIKTLLNHHIVRLRVNSVGSHLLSDVGGPYVLAPVTAPLQLHGREIGSFVLSIQDDEGYLRLARRLAGLKVLMFMDSKLVKNSLGPNPGKTPIEGSFHYRGEQFRTFTLKAQAFPSGTLKIRVLVPIPYS